MPGYANPYAQQQADNPNPGGFDDNFYLNSNPDAAFWRYLQGYGLGGTNNQPAARYAQGQQGRMYNSYQQQAASNPNEGFWDWLRNQNTDFNQEFMNQSPEQRGDFSSRMLTPRARWTGG